MGPVARHWKDIELATQAPQAVIYKAKHSNAKVRADLVDLEIPHGHMKGLNICV